MTHINDQQQAALRSLPGVDRLLEMAQASPQLAQSPKRILTTVIRDTLDALRSQIIQGETVPAEARLTPANILAIVIEKTTRAMTPNLRRVINATGIVVHTNLGRSLLADCALENIQTIAGRYANLEFDLATGKRGSRYSAVEEILCELSGAPAAMVVNNNAAAVLLCLNTVAQGRPVIVSRGELVEIGGSFRIPDVMAKSGAILSEVGTTNRTHLRDYATALTPETALLMKVHSSNFSVVGFTTSVPLADLCTLGKKHGLPVMEDLGSGTFIDFSQHGIRQKEPTIRESVAAGADLITFSGDKLLGGPQAGIILGRRSIIAAIRKNSLTRALRIDKLTLAGLESTLRLYRDEKQAMATIPTLRMLSLTPEAIEIKAEKLAASLMAIGDDRLDVQVLRRTSKAGGGSLPLLELPTRCVGIRVTSRSAHSIERVMRHNAPPIIGRIETDTYLMDLRTLQDDEAPLIEQAVRALLSKTPSGNGP